MAKIRDIIVKPLRRKPVRVTALDGETVLPFELRLLTAEDSSLVEERARAATTAQGVTGEVKQHPTYMRHLMVETILLSAMDEETPVDKGEPFFSDSAQVRTFLDDARLSYVYQEQRAYQSEYAPQISSCTIEEFIELTWASTREAQAGGDPERPFAGLPYRKLRSYAANAALGLTTPMLPQLLFGSQTQPGAGDTSASSSSSDGSESKDSSTT